MINLVPGSFCGQTGPGVVACSIPSHGLGARVGCHLKEKKRKLFKGPDIRRLLNNEHSIMKVRCSQACIKYDRRAKCGPQKPLVWAAQPKILFT